MGSGVSIVTKKNDTAKHSARTSKRIPVGSIERQSALLQRFIGDISKQLCRELTELRTQNAQLSDALKDQVEETNQVRHKLSTVEADNEKLKEQLDFQKKLVGNKSTEISSLVQTLSRTQSDATSIKRHLPRETDFDDLPPGLRDFTPVKKFPDISKIIESDSLRDAEEAVLKDPTSRLSINALKAQVNAISKALKKLLAKRLRTAQIYEKCRSKHREIDYQSIAVVIISVMHTTNDVPITTESSKRQATRVFLR